MVPPLPALLSPCRLTPSSVKFLPLVSQLKFTLRAVTFHLESEQLLMASDAPRSSSLAPGARCYTRHPARDRGNCGALSVSRHSPQSQGQIAPLGISFFLPTVNPTRALCWLPASPFLPRHVALFKAVHGSYSPFLG